MGFFCTTDRCAAECYPIELLYIFMLKSAANPNVPAVSLTLATLLWGVHFRICLSLHGTFEFILSLFEMSELHADQWNRCGMKRPERTVVSAVWLHAACSSSQWNPAQLLLGLSWMKLEGAVFFMNRLSNSWWSSESNQFGIKNIHSCPLESGTILKCFQNQFSWIENAQFSFFHWLVFFLFAWQSFYDLCRLYVSSSFMFSGSIFWSIPCLSVASFCRSVFFVGLFKMTWQ